MKQENVERKICSGRKFTLSSIKFRAVWKKQTMGRNAKSYRELGRKILIHPNTVKKYLTTAMPKTDNESYVTVEGNTKVIMQQRMSSLYARPSFQRRFCW
jgi:DNA-binding transcriptional regulator YhcF (GntR family)